MDACSFFLILAVLLLIAAGIYIVHLHEAWGGLPDTIKANAKEIER